MLLVLVLRFIFPSNSTRVYRSAPGMPHTCFYLDSGFSGKSTQHGWIGQSHTSMAQYQYMAATHASSDPPYMHSCPHTHAHADHFCFRFAATPRYSDGRNEDEREKKRCTNFSPHSIAPFICSAIYLFIYLARCCFRVSIRTHIGSCRLVGMDHAQFFLFYPRACL